MYSFLCITLFLCTTQPIFLFFFLPRFSFLVLKYINRFYLLAICMNLCECICYSGSVICSWFGFFGLSTSSAFPNIECIRNRTPITLCYSHFANKETDDTVSPCMMDL